MSLQSEIATIIGDKMTDEMTVRLADLIERECESIIRRRIGELLTGDALVQTMTGKMPQVWTLDKLIENAFAHAAYAHAERFIVANAKLELEKKA